jgi:hypothetical protein
MNNKLTQSQETNASRSQRLIGNAGFGGIRAAAHAAGARCIAAVR